MIKYIKGILQYVDLEQVIIEVNGIGYGINVPTSVIDSIGKYGSEVKLHTYMNVKEDDVSLYGFLTKDDLDIFKKIISVSGVGPKGALGILSTLSSDDLRFAVLSDDAKAIAKAPGIGAKTASKIILELKDKITLEDAFETKSKNVQTSTVSKANPEVQDAIEALTALGFSSSDVLKVIRQIDDNDNMSAQDIIKNALKML